MKKLYNTLSFLFILISASAIAQTNVGGGIYTNTAWTLANSPYIVVDTVVVFPGVTLTIEAGVVVKFDNNMRLEIRQASLIANGTITDSITFTSNSGSPIPGIWESIWLNEYPAHSGASFNFCNIKYSHWGITGTQDTLNIRNSNFTNNIYGLTSNAILIDSCNFKYNSIGLNGGGAGFINFCNISHNTNGTDGARFGEMVNCVIDSNQSGMINFIGYIHNCTINYNQYGIMTYDGHHNVIKDCIIDSNSVRGVYLTSVESDSLINCEVKFNGIGVKAYSDSFSPCTIIYNIIENNATGIQLDGIEGRIYCNKICNNSSYDLEYTVAFGSNTSVANNYWCTSDSLSTTLRIYDGYDNVNLGLVSFMPMDTSMCYLTIGIPVNLIQNFYLSIFPNPASDFLTLRFANNSNKSQIRIINLLGEIKYDLIREGAEINLNISTLTPAIYFIEVANSDRIVYRKFVKE